MAEKFSFKKLNEIGTVSPKQVLFFTKNLAVMLKAGATLPESISVLKEQTKGKLKAILDHAHSAVNQGLKFSDALRRYPKVFPEMYCNIIEIGEETGRLPTNLDHLAIQMEKNYELKRKILSAMMYPSVVFVGGVALSMSIAIFVLPNISKLFKNFKVELPFTTRMLLAVSDFFQQYGLIAVGGIFGLMILGFWLLKRQFMRPVTHWMILHIPVVKSISMHLNVALFCRTLSSLLESGVTIDEGLRICAKSSRNYYYKKFLKEAHSIIKAGGSLSSILTQNKKLFNGTDIQIINVGETSGTLSNSLTYCSEIHENEVDNLTKNLSTILEPILLITIGLMVGFLALSIITPIYSITGQFRK